tara:strand:- start:819 stop:1100 length:282 start_codon:yes stop_codon:yes gene_type:complete
MGSFARNKYQNSEAMVVSPQPMITDAVTSTLREQSFKQVVALNNGLDAMERARNISPSLILLMNHCPIWPDWILSPPFAPISQPCAQTSRLYS